MAELKDADVKKDANLRHCFFDSGALVAFSYSDRCPDRDRDWIKRAGESLMQLATEKISAQTGATHGLPDP